MRGRFRLTVLLLLLGAVSVAWYKRDAPKPAGTLRSSVVVGTHKEPWENIVEGAKQQADAATSYNASYARIAYPNGDVPWAQGACTDVVIRALRHAGYDLQQLIHEDMKRRLSEYPKHGLFPDSNIDHRRVPNQICFFSKYGQTLTNEVSPATIKEWRPGDFVYWKAYGRDHTGVISDKMGFSGHPMVIHNLSGCMEADCLTDWQIVGHYRYPADGSVER